MSNIKLNKGTTFSVDCISTKRDIYESQKPIVPIADLSGKGVFDSVSSNRSKQNDQNS